MNVKLPLILFFILFAAQIDAFSQELHHQMVSSQATTKVTSSGMIIKQTIGQQSVSGTSSGSVIVQQGFQQSYWSKFIAASQANPIGVNTYPNPCREFVNFQFSIDLGTTTVDILIFDINGRIVFSKTEKMIGTLLTLDLPSLPSAPYLVRLSSSQFNYFTKIIKI